MSNDNFTRVTPKNAGVNRYEDEKKEQPLSYRKAINYNEQVIDKKPPILRHMNSDKYKPDRLESNIEL